MLKPLNDHLIVKPQKGDEKSAGGIILPNMSKEKPETGEVVAVGPGKLLDNGQRAPMSVNPGDKIVFTKYSPNVVKFGGEDYLVLT